MTTRSVVKVYTEDEQVVELELDSNRDVRSLYLQMVEIDAACERRMAARAAQATSEVNNTQGNSNTSSTPASTRALRGLTPEEFDQNGKAAPHHGPAPEWLAQNGIRTEEVWRWARSEEMLRAELEASWRSGGALRAELADTKHDLEVCWNHEKRLAKACGPLAYHFKACAAQQESTAASYSRHAEKADQDHGASLHTMD